MNIQKRRIYLHKNNHAVLGLPMRLTISVVVGTIVLLSILSVLLNPCVFPGRMIVSVTPMVTTVLGSEPENATFLIAVNDTQGHPLDGAAIIIKGLGGAGSGFTDETGYSIVELQIHLPEGFYEGYLDISVKVPCYISFEQQDMIKIVKST